MFDIIEHCKNCKSRKLWENTFTCQLQILVEAIQKWGYEIRKAILSYFIT